MSSLFARGRFSGLFTDRTWNVELPALHYFFGAAYFILAVLVNYDDPEGIQHVYDFWVFYRAGTLSHTAPEQVYNLHYFMYTFVGTDVSKPYGYINPPPFLLFLYPLGYLPMREAIMAWSVFNLALTIVIFRQVLRIIDVTGLQAYRNVCKSLVFGTFAWAHTIFMGQTAIVVACGMAGFILAYAERKETRAMLWLSLVACVKPHIAVPIFAFLAGRGQWRMLMMCAAGVAAQFALTALVMGMGPITAFIETIINPSSVTAGSILHFRYMVNLRGIVTDLFFAQYQLIGQISVIIYGAFVLLAFLAGFSKRLRDWQQQRLLLGTLIFASMFFSPWMHTHDSYVLLPVMIYMLGEVITLNGRHWIKVPYLILFVSLSGRDLAIYATRAMFITMFAILGVCLWRTHKQQRTASLS